MSVVSRVVGALVLGAGAYAGVLVLQPDWTPAVTYAVTGLAAVTGALVGPKGWEIVAAIF